jgi:hypothetical protein
LLIVIALQKLVISEPKSFALGYDRVDKCVDHDDFSSLLQKGPARSWNPDWALVEDEEMRLNEKRNITAANFWTHPVTVGMMLGFLLIGPDHVGTLMALSTLTSGYPAFKVGFAWGLGHSLGVVILCPALLFLKELAHISMERWEYIGDYFIGCSMLLLAIYFLVYESEYIEKQSDGSYKAKACLCHQASEIPTGEIPTDDFFRQCRPCDPAQSEDGGSAEESSESSKNMPSLQNDERSAALSANGFLNFVSAREIQGVVLGVCQGLCCPMSIASVGLMGRMSTTSSPTMLLLFSVVFVLSFTLGSGAITYSWGAITTRGSDSWVATRTMYRASCVALFLLGSLWIIANYCGVLDSINFGDKIGGEIHDKLMNHAKLLLVVAS